MLALLTLAWRNIWRNRRRTLISMSAISLGLALVLFFGGITGRFIEEAKDQLDNTGLGHVEITAAGWRTHRSAKLVLKNPDEMRAKLALPPGAEVGARLLARGLLSAAHGNDAVEVHGVDWPDEAKLADYLRALPKGAVPANDDEKGILIGDRLAAKMHLAVGNEVV